MTEELEKAEAALTPAERAHLLLLAREALAAHLEERPEAPASGIQTPRLLAPGAAFVTLRAKGELRGCIGTTRFERALREVVPELAVAAATSDRRFDAIDRSELEAVKIAISVLSPLRPARVEEIEIGFHGLVVRQRKQSGLLLPQVASERGWDRLTFLAETSRKAGLPPDAWRQPGAQVLWFSAERFSEDGRD